MNNSFSLGKAFNDGWAAFKENMGIAIGGYAIMFAVGLVFAIPIIGALAALVVSGPLIGGYLLFFLKVSENNKPEIGDLFSGFSRFGEFLGMYWMLILIVIGCYLPGGIVVAIGAVMMESSETMGGLLIAVGMVALVGALVFFGVRYCFAFFILADESGDGTVMGALKDSKQMTEGLKLKIFGSIFLISILSSIGSLALIVGILFTAPLAACIGCHIYLQLRGEPLAATVVEPVEGSH